MLSEFEIIVNTSGVTVICPYLYTPRFIPFDQKGRCKTCKSDNVEIDYVIQPEGITIFCSRLIKEKFVPFDKSAQFNQKDANYNSRAVRIRSRSKSYNIPISRALYLPTVESRALYLPTVETHALYLPTVEARALEEKRELASIDSDKNFATPYDTSLNISDIPLPSLITLTSTENISLPTQTDISSHIPLGSVEPPLPSPTLIKPSDSTNVNELTTHTPPVISPISFFPDL